MHYALRGIIKKNIFFITLSCSLTYWVSFMCGCSNHPIRTTIMIKKIKKLPFYCVEKKSKIKIYYKNIVTGNKLGCLSMWLPKYTIRWHNCQSLNYYYDCICHGKQLIFINKVCRPIFMFSKFLQIHMLLVISIDNSQACCVAHMVYCRNCLKI